MSTPEGKVKREVEKLFARCSKDLNMPVHYFMPVQTGYGKRDLDYNCTVNGFALRIETKAPGEWLTGPQRLIAKAVFEAGGAVFIVSSEDGLSALSRWIWKACAASNPLR